MTPEDIHELTKNDLIERLHIDVMGRPIEDLQYACSKDGSGNITSKAYYWDPTINWNHTMEVVKKIIPAFGLMTDPQRAICLAALLSVSAQ